MSWCPDFEFRATHRPASTLLFNDANWMVQRIQLDDVWFTDPALDADLVQRFGIDRLSKVKALPPLRTSTLPPLRTLPVPRHT